MPVYPTPLVSGDPIPPDYPYWAGVDCEVPFIRWETGKEVYATITRGDQIIKWEGYTLVSYNPADWAQYAIPTFEIPTGSGQYRIPFDNRSEPDYYQFAWYTPTTPGSPAIGDRSLNIVRPYWNGLGRRFGEGHLVKASSDTLTSYNDLVATGSVNDPSPTATTFICSADTGLSDDPNVYRTLSVCFTDGALKAAKSVVTAWNGTTRRITVAGFAQAPANGDNFMII